MEKPSKFYFSELLLAGYLVSLITLDSSVTYTRYDNLMALVFMTGCGIEMYRCGGIRFDRIRFILPICMFAVFSSLTLLLNLEGLQQQITLLLNFALFFCVFLVIRTTHRTWPIEIGLAIGVLIIWKMQGSVFTEYKDYGGERMVFTLGADETGLNPNTYGLYLALTLFFSIKFFFVDSRIGNKSLFWWVRLISLTTVSLISIQQILFVTGSKKAYLMLAGVVGVSYLVNIVEGGKRKIFKLIAGGAFAVVVTLLMWFTIKQSDYFTRVENLTNFILYQDLSDVSTELRMSMAREAFHMWKASPIFGHGTGGFASKSGYGTYSHSDYLEVLCNHGIIGFMLYYFPFLRTLRLNGQWLHSDFPSVRKYGIWLLGTFGWLCLFFIPFAVSYQASIMAVYLGCIFGIVSFIENSRKAMGNGANLVTRKPQRKWTRKLP